MKAQKKIIPAILGTASGTKQYQIRIEMGGNRWAELIFSDRDQATSEFNRIRAASIYCSAWVTTITLTEKEIKNETMA